MVKKRNVWAIKKKDGKTPLSDQKPIGGTNHLTGKMMNKMQGNTDSIYQMKKAIWEILWHCSVEGTPSTCHHFCTRNNGTWCRYCKSQERGIPIEQYGGGGGGPDCIRKILKPIFEDLTQDSLLVKMLARKYTKQHESLNGVVWKHCPKDIYVGLEVLEIGVASAVICYNDGLGGIAGVLHALNIDIRR